MTSSQVNVDTDKIEGFYDRYVKDHGISAGWSNQSDADNAYREVSSCSAQKWDEFQSVLDVGSGAGHLLKLLRHERHFTGHYVGIELLDFFHDQALEFYGEMENAEFIQAEFLGYDFGETHFDWVISLGSFSVKQSNQAESDLAFCRKMIALANYGVSIFLNDIDQMRPGRLEEVPDLAAHNINDFVAMVRDNFDVSDIAVNHYPTERSQPTMIHIVL